VVVAAMASRLCTSTAPSVREGTLLCSVILVGFLFSAAGIPAATCKALAACESSQSSLRPTSIAVVRTIDKVGHCLGRSLDRLVLL